MYFYCFYIDFFFAKSCFFQVESFFGEQSDLGSGVRAVRQAVEIIKHNIQWLEKNENLVNSFLQDRSTSACLNS